MKSQVSLFKIFLAAFALTLMPITLSGSGDGPLCVIYRGYISGDMEMWKKGMAELQDLYRKDPSSYNLYNLVEVRYGYIGYLMGEEKKADVKPYIDEFEQCLEKMAAYPDRKADIEAFRVALLGYRMWLSPAKAISLGPKALKQLEKAMEFGNNNPAVWVEKANSETHMPSFAGGSKVKAAESFRQAIRLFEGNEATLECNWRYLNTILLLGKVLEQTDNYKEACEVYQKALLKEPSFKQVRDELLPSAEKKIR